MGKNRYEETAQGGSRVRKSRVGETLGGKRVPKRRADQFFRRIRSAWETAPGQIARKKKKKQKKKEIPGQVARRHSWRNAEKRRDRGETVTKGNNRCGVSRGGFSEVGKIRKKLQRRKKDPTTSADADILRPTSIGKNDRSQGNK